MKLLKYYCNRTCPLTGCERHSSKNTIGEKEYDFGPQCVEYNDYFVEQLNKMLEDPEYDFDFFRKDE